MFRWQGPTVTHRDHSLKGLRLLIEIIRWGHRNSISVYEGVFPKLQEHIHGNLYTIHKIKLEVWNSVFFGLLMAIPISNPIEI